MEAARTGGVLGQRADHKLLRGVRQRLPPELVFAAHRRPHLRVRGEIMGSQKCRTVGKSQPVLMMIDPIISTRTRIAIEANKCIGAHAWR